MNLFLDDLPLWFDPDGVCRGPGGDGRVVADLARRTPRPSRPACSSGPGYENEALDLTGEESHSLGELAALCSEILDRPLPLRAGDARGVARVRLAAGVPAWDANIGVGSYEALLGGEFDVTSQVVRRVTGTPAESVRAWVEANPGALRAPRSRRARTPRAAASPPGRAPAGDEVRRGAVVARRSPQLDRRAARRLLASTAAERAARCRPAAAASSASCRCPCARA